MQVPNILTVSRFFIAAAILAALALPFPYLKSLALLLFIAGGITDFLDGYLARNHYGTSSFGKLMDPLADKVMVCACFVSFAEIRLEYEPAMALVPAWIVVLIISREFMVTGLRLLAASKGKTMSAGKWGKHKTVWQIFAIVVILLGLAVRADMLPQDEMTLRQFDFAFKWTALALSAAVAVITIASGVKYFTDHADLVSRNM